MGKLDQSTTERALRLSLLDGACATIMASLAGGIFLVGFALNVLGANTVQVGILAALPVSANVAQLLGATLIESFGRRRWLCLLAVTGGRLVWIVVMLLPLTFFDSVADWRAWLLVGLVGLSCLFGALAGVAWLEWMSDVIPENIRGAYFGRRNMVCAASGMVAVLAGGAFLSWWEGLRGREDPFGYLILFGSGLAIGLLASWFLARIPDPADQSTTSEKRKFQATALLRPFADGNFVALVFYVSAFMFATQLAGPFYSVFMIENLGIGFGTITWFITFATLTSLFMLRLWGPISDQMGNRPVLIVAGAAHALIPLMWVVSTPGSYFWPVALAHVASGAFFSAIMLAQVNILIKLSPERGKSVFIAVFNASIGLAAGVAPIIGGWLLEATSSVQWQVGDWTLGNLHLLFLLSGLLQLLVLTALFRVQEEGALSSTAVLQQLRTDLDPQTGVAGATDFLAVNLHRTEGALRGIDRLTDDWAGHSEAVVGRFLKRKVRPSRLALVRLRRYLTDF